MEPRPRTVLAQMISKRKDRAIKTQDSLEVSGNNGGSYVKITTDEENIVLLEVGHDCIMTMKRKVLVTDLARVLTDAQDSLEFEHGDMK